MQQKSYRDIRNQSGQVWKKKKKEEIIDKKSRIIAMMPRKGINTVGKNHGYVTGTDFTQKVQVLNMVRHNQLPTFRYWGIIGVIRLNMTVTYLFLHS